MIITDWQFYVIAIPGVIALGLGKGGFAGAGQMSVPMLALIMSPLEASAIFAPILMVQDIAAVWAFRREWDRRLIAIIIPGAIVGVGVAWITATLVSDAAVRVFLAVTTLTFCLYSWFGRYLFKAKQKPTSAKVWTGLLWSAISGFTSTICGSGGPPYQIYAMPLKLPKMVFVGTTAIYFMTLNSLKIVPYLALGQFTETGFRTSLLLIPLALASNALGVWLVRRTPEALFYRITLIVMFILAFALLRTGLHDLI